MAVLSFVYAGESIKYKIKKHTVNQLLFNFTSWITYHAPKALLNVRTEINQYTYLEAATFLAVVHHGHICCRGDHPAHHVCQ